MPELETMLTLPASRLIAEAPELQVIDPPQYSIAWIILTVLCGVLITAIITAVLRLTRRAAIRRSFAQRPSDEDGLKAEFLRTVNEVESRAERGEISSRAAHQELTLVMRRFVRRTTGLDVTSQDLSALLKHPDTREVGQLIADLYEPDYAERTDVTIQRSAQRARAVIRAWS